MLDLHPAVARMAALVQQVGDEQLEGPTPCGTFTVGDVVDHVGTVARAFGAKATKAPGSTGGPPPPPSAGNLEPGWRARIATNLDALAAAWSDPAAWEGDTVAGGIPMPAAVAGGVVLDELVVHGWDIAVSTGQPFQPSPEDVQAAIEFASTFEAPRDGRLFGPIVDVPADAPALNRLLGLTGRDPAWTAP